MTDTPKRGRGRPPGSKNRPKGSQPATADVTPASRPTVDPPSPAPAPLLGTTRATLEADRDRLLAGITACESVPNVDGSTSKDWKTIAALQGQLNGVNRMLLRITGETAPTDANLIRAPQYLRLKNDLIAALKKHPAALADVVRVFDTAEA